MPRFSIRQQIEELEREVELRARVYPNFVRKGSMTPSVAEYHTERLRLRSRRCDGYRRNKTAVREFVAAKAKGVAA